MVVTERRESFRSERVCDDYSGFLSTRQKGTLTAPRNRTRVLPAVAGGLPLVVRGLLAVGLVRSLGASARI